MENKNILAIDDEETCLEVIKFSLECSGYNVITASNGNEGIKLAQNNNPKIDLILLDMMLPDMYGLEALEKIKKIKSMAHIPVIMQTGTSNDEDMKKAIKLGAHNKLIRKPYGRIELLNVVREVLIENISLA